MKKKIIILCSIFLTVFMSGFGQKEVLLLKNKATAELKFIRENSKIKVYCKNVKEIQGVFVLNDSIASKNEIIIKEHESNIVSYYNININDIGNLLVKPTAKNILGYILIPVGIITMVYGGLNTGYALGHDVIETILDFFSSCQII